MEKTYILLPRGKEDGGINWEIGIYIYTLLYIKWITNKGLLYSTGNSTQYSVMTYMGKNLKKKNGYMCVYIKYITKSLCCPPENNTAL